MPSDGTPPAPRAGAPLAWLRSQGLGLVCGFATVVLLAIGSVVVAATRDGASAGVGLDDLRGFFSPPRAAHLWLYLLLPVVGLYALNTVLATWDSVARKWRAGLRAPAAYAAAVIHVGFLLALIAHGVGGFWGSDGEPVLVASGFRAVPGFGEARLLDLEVDSLPGGMPRTAWARLEVRTPEGRLEPRAVGYNVPLSAGGGARLALLGDLGRAWVAHLSIGDQSCAATEGQDCVLSGERVELLAFAPAEGGAPAAVIRSRGPSGRPEVRAVGRGGELPLAGGRLLTVDALAPEQAVLLRVRSAPGNPWALGAAVLMVAGVGLMWRKLAR